MENNNRGIWSGCEGLLRVGAIHSAFKLLMETFANLYHEIVNYICEKCDSLHIGIRLSYRYIHPLDVGCWVPDDVLLEASIPVVTWTECYTHS